MRPRGRLPHRRLPAAVLYRGLCSSDSAPADVLVLRKAQLLQIARARQNKNAPVDIMGCGSVADVSLLAPTCQEIDAQQAYRFECLVAGVLSAQNRDEVTALAVHKLREGGMLL